MMCNHLGCRCEATCVLVDSFRRHGCGTLHTHYPYCESHVATAEAEALAKDRATADLLPILVDNTTRRITRRPLQPGELPPG